MSVPPTGDQEWLTRPLSNPRADDSCVQFQQRLVDVQSPLKAHTPLSEAGKSSMGSPHYPTGRGKFVLNSTVNE